MLDEAYAQRLRLANNLSQRLLEQYGLHGAVDLDVFADIVRRVPGIDVLSEPNSKLGARKRECSAIVRGLPLDLQPVPGVTIERRHRLDNPVRYQLGRTAMRRE